MWQARSGSPPKTPPFSPSRGVNEPPVSEQNSLTMTTTVHSRAAALRLDQFLALTKPRVVSLIVFTAVIGMFLATPGLPPLKPMLFGTLGIALVAAAGAVIHCLVEQKIDAKMARTRAGPPP